MAATGTPTPNLGLRIPVGTDPASVDDINYNSNLLDTVLGAVGNTSVKDQLDGLSDQIALYGIRDTSPNLPNTTIGAGATSILTLTGFTGRKLVNVSAVGEYPVGTRQKFIITSAWIEGDNLNVAVTNISGSSHSGVLQVQVLYVTNIQGT